MTWALRGSPPLCGCTANPEATHSRGHFCTGATRSPPLRVRRGVGHLRGCPLYADFSTEPALRGSPPAWSIASHWSTRKLTSLQTYCQDAATRKPTPYVTDVRGWPARKPAVCGLGVGRHYAEAHECALSVDDLSTRKPTLSGFHLATRKPTSAKSLCGSALRESPPRAKVHCTSLRGSPLRRVNGSDPPFGRRFAARQAPCDVCGIKLHKGLKRDTSPVHRLTKSLRRSPPLWVVRGRGGTAKAMKSNVVTFLVLSGIKLGAQKVGEWAFWYAAV